MTSRNYGSSLDRSHEISEGVTLQTRMEQSGASQDHRGTALLLNWVSADKAALDVTSIRSAIRIESAEGATRNSRGREAVVTDD
jgi:hypothetical protein